MAIILLTFTCKTFISQPGLVTKTVQDFFLCEEIKEYQGTPLAAHNELLQLKLVITNSIEGGV